jgi:hypothetical protein
MLFGETVAVYCENHTEHTDAVRTSQETHYISATEPNRLMLFRETIAALYKYRKSRVPILLSKERLRGTITSPIHSRLTSCIPVLKKIADRFILILYSHLLDRGEGVDIQSL